MVVSSEAVITTQFITWDANELQDKIQAITALYAVLQADVSESPQDNENIDVRCQCSRT